MRHSSSIFFKLKVVWLNILRLALILYMEFQLIKISDGKTLRKNLKNEIKLLNFPYTSKQLQNRSVKRRL